MFPNALGFLSLAVAFGLAVTSLSSEWIWLQPYLLDAAIFFFVASLICFFWSWPAHLYRRFGPPNFARQKLRALRKEGVSIRNEGQFTTTPQSWTPKFLAWHSAILKQAARLSPDLEASLDTLNKIPPESLEKMAVDNRAHQINVSFMSEAIRRIERFLATGIIYGQ
jgi:hypothetical protein